MPNRLVPTRLLLAAGLFAAVAACEDVGEVRDWAPTDHHNNTKANQVTGTAEAGQEDATLVAVTWRQNCARCHGMSGQGDGPEGRILRVPDLTRPSFQKDASDDEIANVIRRGRNKMPAFETLPPKVIDGLVAHIRKLGAERR